LANFLFDHLANTFYVTQNAAWPLRIRSEPILNFYKPIPNQFCTRSEQLHSIDRKKMKIPFSPPYIDQDVINKVVDVLRSGWITTGPVCKAFEDGLKDYTGADAVIAVNSWTAGAELVLRWFGVGPGDEVIVPAYTYAATAMAVYHTGAKVVMVDVGEDRNMDPAKLAEAIGPRTKAVIPVDVGGMPCDYEAILKVVEDYRSKKV
jgi:dTDP-4-amino-4,6-dideoxygalactose transaminase